MAPKMTPEEIREAAANLALDEAYVLREQNEALRRKLNANRSELQNARDLGHLTEEQRREVDELYPVRERASAEERIERLREQLAKAEEKAAKESGRNGGSEQAEETDEQIAETAAV